MALSVLAFVVVFATVLLVYAALVLVPERQARRRLRHRLESMRAASEVPAFAPLVREHRWSRVPFLDRLLARAGHGLEAVQRIIRQAGLDVTVGAVCLACVCMAVAGYVAVMFVAGTQGTAMAAAVAGFFLPIAYGFRARRKRLRQFEELFPEAVEIIARSLRAGHAFTSGLALVAEEAPEPIRSEFRTLYTEQTYGRPLPEALREFADRVPLVDAKFFVTAVLTQRDTGGNLSQVLDGLATVVRSRLRARRQIHALTANGRFTGWILAALPPAMAVILAIISPDHLRTFINDPIGARLVGAAALAQIVGTFFIYRIVNFEY